MIYDNLLTLTCNTPSGVPFSISTAPFDANPNIASYGKAFPLIDPTQRLIARFRVTEAFATATDAAVQLFLVAGAASNFATTNAVLACATGPLQIFNATTYYYGFKAADLALNSVIEVPIASIDNFHMSGLDVQTLRWIGCGISVPNYQAGPSLTAGKIECAVILDHGSNQTTNRANLYPSAMAVR